MMKMNQIKLLYDSDDFLLYLPKNKNCVLRSVKNIYLKNIQEKEEEKNRWKCTKKFFSVTHLAKKCASELNLLDI